MYSVLAMKAQRPGAYFVMPTIALCFSTLQAPPPLGKVLWFGWGGTTCAGSGPLMPICSPGLSAAVGAVSVSERPRPGLVVPVGCRQLLAVVSHPPTAGSYHPFFRLTTSGDVGNPPPSGAGLSHGALPPQPLWPAYI